MVQALYHSITKHEKLPAFCIADNKHSYKELASEIQRYRNVLKPVNESLIGIVAHDHFETYAAIIALWFEGKAYLPLNPDFPQSYNEDLIDKAGLAHHFDAASTHSFSNSSQLKLTKPSAPLVLEAPKENLNDALAYLLFTSGSTGKPKGVPITQSNLNAFVKANEQAGIVFNHESRCLQMFDLSFDLSVGSFLLPLLFGGSVFTIPKDEIKYAYILKLLSDYKLTHALMVPSVLTFLNRTVSTENGQSLEQCLFCGEALDIEAAKKWQSLAENARVYNVYGPTEASIYCTYHRLDLDEKNASENGVVSIGQEMLNVDAVLINEGQEEVNLGEIGELYLSGEQVCSSYWNNAHTSAFITLNGKPFYRTGDLAVRSANQDLHFLGRLDSQVKVNGFRVELLDVENRIKRIIAPTDAMVLSYEMPYLGTSLALIIESDDFDTTALKNELETQLPEHMIPSKIGFMKEFPLNTNGKKDRRKVQESL